MRAFDDTRDRSQQTKDYRLGVSDIGTCRQYATLLTKQTPFTDAPDRGAAMLGTFIHTGIEQVMLHHDPDLIVGAEVTVDLPNGVQLSGHPDRVDVAENSVTDDKTVAALGDVRRAGPTPQQEWQVLFYAAGACQIGMLNPDAPITTRICWWDRTGKEDVPHVWQTTFPDYESLMSFLEPALEWLDDVMYAVRQDEDASRDKPVDWCAAACQFYSTCRVSDLPEVDELITDPTVVRAVDSYQAGLAMAKEAASLKDAGKELFDGISGMVRTADGRMMRLRWITVGEKIVAEHPRAAHRRLDLREVKAP
jgi:hypothetical protein